MIVLLPLLFLLLLLVVGEGNWRERYARAAIWFGVVVVLVTECAGAVGLLTHGSVSIIWSVLVVLLALWVLKHRNVGPIKSIYSGSGWIDRLLACSIVSVLAVLGFTALASPPNSADAMAYHMPRVIYWVQQGSVSFFPTPYLNQIMLSPIAEYFMLHTVLLANGDWFVNTIQWFGCVTSVVGVSLIAKELGAKSRGQFLAAVFCVTLPNGILQASGAKNDYLLTGWLVLMTWFYLRSQSRSDILFGGLALALALGTKATAFLFAPPLLIAVFLSKAEFAWGRILRTATVALACVVAIDGWQFARNMDLSGSPLGFDSAQADGVYRWRNETFGIRNTTSNFLRNLSEQLGSRSEDWNRRVYNSVAGIHRWIGADLNSEATTFHWSEYRAPRNANHEADAPNTLHLLILSLCGIALTCPWRKWETRTLRVYFLALLTGCLLFCFYLKWQPFMSRMWLPLFVLGAPLVGLLVSRIPSALLHVALALVLLSGARLPLLQNWTRRLQGPTSLLTTARDLNYFNDMTQWNNTEAYLKTIDLLAGSACRRIGVDINLNQVEYPVLALLRERRPGVEFVHTGVTNPSSKYQREATIPCAVVCLDCAGRRDKMEQYQSIGKPQSADRFLIFLK